MEVKFGYVGATEHYSPKEVIEQAILAEENGLDGIWVSDHFHPWHTKGNVGMAWPIMAAIAERTKRIAPISTNVTCPTIRYNPAIVAHTFATLAVMYPRRIALGVGSGEAMNELPLTGKWPKASKRLDMLVEAVKIIRMLWESDNPVTFKGKYFQLTGAKLYTKPKEEIPLFFAADGPKACELAGKYGDHWITVRAEPEHIKNVTLPAFERGAREAGKNPAKMKRMAVVLYSIDKNYDKAVEACRPFAAALIPEMFKYGVYDPKELEEHGNIVSRERIEGNCIVGTSPESIIEKLDGLIKVGINYFALLNLSPQVKEGIKIIGEKIIPYFKS